MRRRQLYHGEKTAISWGEDNYIMRRIQLYHEKTAISWGEDGYIMGRRTYIR
jgi:hypothetical protein